jgi:Tfp pilus assembly protein PilO
MQVQSNNLFKNIQKNKYLEMLPDFKEERTQKFTTLVLTVVALSFFGLFAISPTISTIANLNKQLDDNKFVDQQLQTKINNLYVLQQKYTEITPDLPYVFNSIPKSPEVPLLVAQIQSIAKDSGISVTGLQTFETQVPDPTTAQKDNYAYTFSLSANGSYDNIAKFANSIANMQRVISINILSITRNTGEGPAMQVNFKGTAYYKE